VQQNPLTPTVARQGKAKAIHDARWQPLLADTGWSIGSIASIPIYKSDCVLGVLDVSFQETHVFDQGELSVLSLLCEQAAIAIENARLYADLQHANDTKDELAGVISHALKAPMTSIQGYARLMTLETRDPITEQQRAFLDTILRNVRYVNALINDWLELSRIEAGQIQTSPTPVDLPNSIEQAVHTVRRELGINCELGACSPPITVSLPQDLPVVCTDADWIALVWVHLLRNAFRYTPESSKIRIWAEQHNTRREHPSTERWVLCAVGSTEAGFSPEEHEKIFEPFYRIEHPDAVRQRGTGLELAISRAVVELYGGRMWAESEPGKGSTVFFTLPQA
jgi:signal transduction histidine kinase